MLKSLTLILGSVALAASSDIHAQTGSSGGAINDAQIAMIAVTADSIDIDAGHQAEKKASSSEVKAFARTMVRDHSAVNHKATALAKKLGVTPEANATSNGLKAEADKMAAKLEGLSGIDFDKAYIDNEVAYHEKVIAAVTGTLIPNTKNPELKSLLESAGPIFQAHLEHAKHLQASLTK